MPDTNDVVQQLTALTEQTTALMDSVNVRRAELDAATTTATTKASEAWNVCGLRNCLSGIRQRMRRMLPRLRVMKRYRPKRMQ